MYKIITTLCLMLLLASCETKTETTITKTDVVNGLATSTFKVWGNCDMCKETIENSLKVDGVTHADWNVESKLITVSYDTTKINLDGIQKKISLVGYDTDKYKGDDKAYKALEECCQYDRK